MRFSIVLKRNLCIKLKETRHNIEIIFYSCVQDIELTATNNINSIHNRFNNRIVPGLLPKGLIQGDDSSITTSVF